MSDNQSPQTKEGQGFLTEDQQKVAHLLSEGLNPSQASKRLGIYRQKIYRWLEDDDFLHYCDFLRSSKAVRAPEKGGLSSDVYKKRLNEFRERRYMLGTNTRNLGVAILSHVKNELTPEKLRAMDLTPMELMQLGNFALKIIDQGFSVESEALAIQGLMEELKLKTVEVEAE